MITTIEPRVAADGRYSPTQVCKLLGVSRSTLHRWTEAGYIRFGLRRNTGRKFYKGSEITRFWRAHL